MLVCRADGEISLWSTFTSLGSLGAHFGCLCVYFGFYSVGLWMCALIIYSVIITVQISNTELD